MTTARIRAVTTGLRDLIAGLSLASGDRLPPERALAVRLGCSRQTLRAALDELEASGELWRHVGQGTFYGKRPLGRAVRDTILIESATPRTLMQARLTIEPSVAAEAARLARPANIAYIDGLVAAGRQTMTRPEAEQADAAFHRALAELTGNPVLLGLLDYLAGARRRIAWQREWETTYRRLGVAEFTGHHSDQHAAIVTAVSAADPGAAQHAMRTHLETIMQAMARQDNDADPVCSKKQKGSFRSY